MFYFYLINYPKEMSEEVLNESPAFIYMYLGGIINC